MIFTKRTYERLINRLVVSLLGDGQVMHVTHPVYHKKMKLLKAVRARQIREGKTRR